MATEMFASYQRTDYADSSFHHTSQPATFSLLGHPYAHPVDGRLAPELTVPTNTLTKTCCRRSSSQYSEQSGQRAT